MAVVLDTVFLLLGRIVLLWGGSVVLLELRASASGAGLSFCRECFLGMFLLLVVFVTFVGGVSDHFAWFEGVF